MKKMNEDQLKKLDTLTAKYANGGSPTAFVNSAAQVVGQVRAFPGSTRVVPRAR